MSVVYDEGYNHVWFINKTTGILLRDFITGANQNELFLENILLPMHSNIDF